MSSINIQI